MSASNRAWVYGIHFSLLIVLSRCFIIPPQVLIPYISDDSSIVIRALMRANPARCVFWSTPTPDAICLTSPACLSDNSAAPSPNSFACDCHVNTKCLEAVWVGARGQLTLPYRTWLSISEGADNQVGTSADSAPSQGKSYAEVIVKRLEAIDFQTRNRKIAVGQLATLRLVGFDDERNTFTTLQGIPFRLTNSDSSVMKATELINDPEESTPTRIHLTKNGRFSDVITVQGLKVGECTISIQVDLPEYKHISLKVKFTVSDPFVLEPASRRLPLGSTVNFCLLRVRQDSALRDGDAEVISLPQSYYKWTCESPLADRLSDRGQLSVTYDPLGLERVGSDGTFTVSVRDGRSSDASTASVSVCEPAALGHSVSTLASAVKGWPSVSRIKSLIKRGLKESFPAFSREEFFWHSEQDLYRQAFQRIYSASIKQCAPFPPLRPDGSPAGERDASVSVGDTLNISVGRTYLFRLVLLDARGRELQIPDNVKLSLTLSGEGLRVLWKSPTNHLLVLHTASFGEGSLQFKLSSIGYYTPKEPLTYILGYRVNQRIHIKGWANSSRLHPPDEGADAFQQIVGFYTGTPVRPLYLQPADADVSGAPFSVAPVGGSGVFDATVDTDAFSVTSDSDLVRIQPRGYGFDVLTITDALDPANVYLLPVRAAQVDFLLPFPPELHVAQDDPVALHLLPLAFDKSRAFIRMDSPSIYAAIMGPSDGTGKEAGKQTGFKGGLGEIEARLAAEGYHVVRNFSLSKVKLKHGPSLAVEPRDTAESESHPFTYVLKGLKVGTHELSVDFSGAPPVLVHVYETLKLAISPPPFYPLSAPLSGHVLQEEVPEASWGLFSLFGGSSNSEPAPPEPEEVPDFESTEPALLVGSRAEVQVQGCAGKGEISVEVNRHLATAKSDLVKIELGDSAFFVTCLKEAVHVELLVTCGGPSRLFTIACSYPAYAKIVPYEDLQPSLTASANAESAPAQAKNKASIDSARGRALTLAAVLYDRRGRPLTPCKDVVTHWYQVLKDAVHPLAHATPPSGAESGSFYTTLETGKARDPAAAGTSHSTLRVAVAVGWRLGDRDAAPPGPNSYAGKTLKEFTRSPIYAQKFDRNWTGTMNGIFEGSLTIRLVDLPSIVPPDALYLPTRQVYYMLALDMGPNSSEEQARAVVESFASTGAPAGRGWGRKAASRRVHSGAEITGLLEAASRVDSNAGANPGPLFKGVPVVSLLTPAPPRKSLFPFLVEGGVPGEASASFMVKDVLNSRGGLLGLNFVQVHRVGISVYQCRSASAGTGSDTHELRGCVLQAGPQDSLAHLQVGVPYVFTLCAYDEAGHEIYPPSLHSMDSEIAETGSSKLHFQPLLEGPPGRGGLTRYQLVVTMQGEFVVRGSVDAGKRVYSNFLTIKSFKPFKVATRELVVPPGTANFEFDLVDGPRGVGVGKALGFRYESSNPNVVSVGPMDESDKDCFLTARSVGDAAVTLTGDSSIGLFSLGVDVRVRYVNSVAISPPLLGLDVYDRSAGPFATPHVVCAGHWIPLAAQLTSHDGLAFTPHYIPTANAPVNPSGKDFSGFARDGAGARGAICRFVWASDNELVGRVTEKHAVVCRFHAVTPGLATVTLTATCHNKSFTAAYSLRVVQDPQRASELYLPNFQYNFQLQEASIFGTKLVNYSSKPVPEELAKRAGHLIRVRDGSVSVVGVEVAANFYMHASVTGDRVSVQLVNVDGRAIETPQNLALTISSSRQGVVGDLLVDSSAPRCAPLLVAISGSAPAPYAIVVACGRGVGSKLRGEGLVLAPGARARFAFNPTRYVLHLARPGTPVTPDLLVSEFSTMYRSVVVHSLTQLPADGGSRGNRDYRVVFSFADGDGSLFALQERIAGLTVDSRPSVDAVRAKLQDMARAEPEPAIVNALNAALALLPQPTHYSLLPCIDWYFGIRHDCEADSGGSGGDGSASGCDGVAYEEVGVSEVRYGGERYRVQVVDALDVSIAFYAGPDYYSLSEHPAGDFTLVLKPTINGALYHSTDFVLTGLQPVCEVDFLPAADVFIFTPTHVPLVKDGEVVALPACRCRLGSLDALSRAKFEAHQVKFKVSLHGAKTHFEKTVDYFAAIKSMVGFYDVNGKVLTRVSLGQEGEATVLVYPASHHIKPRLAHLGKPCVALRTDRRGLLVYLTIFSTASGESHCNGHVANLDLGAFPSLFSFAFNAPPLIPGRTLEVYSIGRPTGYAMMAVRGAPTIAPIFTVVLVLLVSYYISRRIQAQGSVCAPAPAAWGRGYIATNWPSRGFASSRSGSINIQRDHMPKVVQDLYHPAPSAM